MPARLTKLPVRGLYTYQARGPDELSVSEGEMLELSSGPSGGKKYSDEWWEGECLDFSTMFPLNYFHPKDMIQTERKVYFLATM